MDLSQLLFGFSGRINRAKYWLAAGIYLAVMLVAVLLFFILGFGVFFYVAVAVLYIAMLISGIAVGIKRLQGRLVAAAILCVTGTARRHRHGHRRLALVVRSARLRDFALGLDRIWRPARDVRSQPLRPRSAGAAVTKKPGSIAGLLNAKTSRHRWDADGLPGRFFVFVPLRVEFNRLGHEFMAHGFQLFDEAASLTRYPRAAVCGLRPQ